MCSVVEGFPLCAATCVKKHSIFLSLAERTGSLGCVGWFLVILSGLFTVVLFPITIWLCVKVSEHWLREQKPPFPFFFAYLNPNQSAVSLLLLQIVQEYERAVIFRLGRITDRKPKGPGRHTKQ